MKLPSQASLSPPRHSSTAHSSPRTKMARAKRQKTELAAFAASQPLFEAVRTVNLTIAHDVVKNIHVGVQNNDEHNHIERHVAYMDAIVESWRSATDAYCNIFAQLTSITADKPNEGIGAAESHSFFQEMLETARKAQEAAKRFTSAKERAVPETNTTIGGNTAETVPAVESDDEIELKHKPLNGGPSTSESSNKSTSTATPGKQLARSDRIKLDKSGTRVLWEKGAKEPSVPFAMLGGDEKKEWAAEKSRQKREKQKGRAHEIRTKKGQRERQQEQEQEQKSAPPSEYHSPQLADVEYEDLSAEVDARLKAKEEAEKAKKQEKKRKRESHDSFVDPNAFQEDEEEEDTIEVRHPEKPRKKKFKHSSDETASNPSAPQIPTADSDTIHVGKKEKRKSSAEKEVVVNSKKRKRNKG
ncbi:uncharacterized protein MYCFIDRAFT_172405 [Pseudocercospora fijiensis CIRAD86]|uniref:Uncharacterized protein n=1 Tax=Pseudocercospora fijiensis (strain CIRAD86) TaxID=383855 RepID=M3BBP5_PSEFD|nr:uncharacterized protein MYCFIDRAFT_172405 [Pseudocercospora fijiensis CIRAD86]EME86707.1 hypothetical protein MYCFIDRAFT_172405 [Pseudocercospora fijiensis CIRAD86]